MGIIKASSFHNGLLPISTKKMVCGDQYMVLFRDTMISLLYYYCNICTVTVILTLLLSL